MKKTKTNKKIFTIFSAILGVVFAFITGFTYCVTNPILNYGHEANSTAAYLANQEYRIVNDTTNNPILFGEGAHNFEIALQYSFDYSIDVRLKYSLSWSGGTTYSTDNVILHFANRDNIIYDEEYIYFANAAPAGNTKINIIAGVDFVDPTLDTYFGQKLTISIDEVKIYKEQPSYDGNHTLLKTKVTDPTTQETTTVSLTGPAAQAWLKYKENKTAGEKETNAYVMMYNYRRDFAHGVSFPGLESAYKKPVGTDNFVTGSTWAGGNRAYAGVGMYVIAGSDPLELEIQVAGIWRSNSEPELVATENSVQYNYTSDWSLKNYSTDKLWDVRTFKHYISENTACYIEINDSIEIVSAMQSVLKKDSYRLVTNSITVNPSATTATAFNYAEDSTTDGYISFKQIAGTVDVADTTIYTQDAVSVVNTSKYINGLYNISDVDQQTFNTNLSLINNTAETQEVQLNLVLWYHVGNAETNLYDPDDAEKKRASQCDWFQTYKDAFNTSKNNDLYYSHSDKTDNLSGTKSFAVKIEPYASINLLTSYSVGEGLVSELDDLFDDPTTTDKTEYYDAWTYLVPSFVEVTSTPSSMLTLETTQEDGSTIVSVKNNSNSKITGISLTGFSISELGAESWGLENGDKPFDWDASYWKYYSAPNKSSQLTNASAPTYSKGTYYVRSQSYGVVSLTASNLAPDYSFGVDSEGETDTRKISNSSLELLPGESSQILTYTTSSQVMVTGMATPTSISDPTDVEIINNGTENACIINYSSNSYYLKLKGTVTGSKFSQFDDDSSYSYYVGVVRPGQMIKVSMSEVATIGTNDKVDVTEIYASTVFNNKSWSAKAVAAITSYFNMEKA